MSTATAPTATKTYERTAKEEREHNLRINGDKPLVEVKGFTYPIKGWLFTLGGKWNKDTQSWWVPDHTFHAAQTKADELTKAQQEKANKPKAEAKPKAETKPEAKAPEAPKAQPTTPAPTPAPVAATPVSTDRVVFRVNNLHKATSDLLATVTDEQVKQALQLALDALTLAGDHALAAAK